MKDERSKRPDVETGGILLGSIDTETVWIEQAVGPGPAARHRRLSFEPDSAYHSEQIALAYQDSGRRLTYIGDWHTHPFGSAYLSLRDVKTLRTIAGHAPARIKHPIMLVLADTVGVWRCIGKRWGGWRDRIEMLKLELR